MMFNKNVQSWEHALQRLNQGDARLLVHKHWHEKDTKPDNWTDEEWMGWTEQLIPLTTEYDFGWKIYDLFAPEGPRNVQSFVCGPFGSWDGSTSPYMDGMVFGTLRQPFMDALQHFREEDGEKYLWVFLTQWFYKLEVV